MRRVAIVINPEKQEAVDAAAHAARWLADHVNRVEALEAEASKLPASVQGVDAGELGTADAIVGFGGDGTILRAAALGLPHGTPLLAINLGRVGFLASIPGFAMKEGLQRLVDGSYRVEERLCLQASIGATTAAAVNEIVVETSARGRLVRLTAFVDGAEFLTFPGDGIIVSSATGSTAYSFSAGGPILNPRLKCMVMTPVAPHRSFDRSLVIDSLQEVTIRVDGPQQGAVVIADGVVVAEMDQGASLQIRAAPRVLRLIRMEDDNFLERVRENFIGP